MISCDTNVLFPACDSASPLHEPARQFLHSHAEDKDFCLCEQVLMELYCLLRNPAVCRNPLSAPDAVGVVQRFRTNPHWIIVDVIQDRALMQQVWQWAADPACAYRRIFDMRLAATLQQHQVKDFATRNTKDFQRHGFIRVWDPLSET